MKGATKRKERVMSNEFASAGYTMGQVNAIVKLLKKQAGEDGPERFLRGELTVSAPTRSWYEKDGVIYFSVTSDGTTGEDWIERLEGRGFCIGDCAKQVLRSPAFKATSGVTTEIAVLKGTLFSDDDRITKNVRAEAGKRKLAKPNAEVAYLIREKFMDEELEAMGLWWVVVMHEPVKDSDGDPSLLSAGRDDDGPWLDAFYDYPDFSWGRVCGFAFAASQV